MTPGNVLVLGATGRTGLPLVTALLHKHERVRALVRDATTARTILGKAVDLVEGDLRDAAALRRAVAGCDRIAFVAGANGGTGRGVPREIDYGAVGALVEAAGGGSIARILLLSSAAVTQPEHPHNCTFDSVLKWKLRGEDVLRRSGLPYTIVRALGLRDRPAGRQGIRIVQGDRIAFGEDIARTDLGIFLADVLRLPTPGGFATGFATTSLIGATCEIFNEAAIPGGLWVSAAPTLRPDPAIGQIAA